MKLEWSVWAHADRDAIFDSIEKDNPRAAVGVDKRIGDLVKVLRRFPRSGRPGRVEGTRELVVARTPAYHGVPSYREHRARPLHAVPLSEGALCARAPSPAALPRVDLSRSAGEVDVTRRYQAVLFDLLTGLLDSWSLWNEVAGNAEAGRLWRGEYLRITYKTGRYRPYEDVVTDAADASGLPRRLAAELGAHYDTLQPWPEANGVLTKLHNSGVPLGVVTNCSEVLGRRAAGRLAVPFCVIVTAERAGFYKPEPQPYEMALREIGVAAERCLFVAGSAYDLFGTARVGLPTWWHDRIGMALPAGTPAPLARRRSLEPLPAAVLGTAPERR